MSFRTHALSLATLATCYLAAVSAAAGQTDTTHTEGSTHAAAVAPSAAPSPYPIDVCPISGKKLGKMGRIVVRTYQGREVRLCCTSCAAKFDADPQVGLQKLDEQIIVAQKEDYPLTLCPVSGEKLGEMGKPVDYVYDNQLIRFCCPACVADFTKQPAVYMGKLQAAYTVQKETRGTRPAPHPSARGSHLGHSTHTHH